MRDVVITSFSEAGYELYARRMIETFEPHWPRRVALWAYHEGQSSPWIAGRLEAREIRWRNLFEVSPACRAFVDGCDDVARGRARRPEHRWKPKAVQTGYNFRYDACKFARKPFAVASAAEDLGSGRLFWIDADTLTHASVPDELLDWALPAGVDLSYLGRPAGYHSECGFVGYRLPEALGFIKAMADEYASGRYRDHAEWHDSWVFDRVRERFNLRQKNLSPEGRSSQPFDASILGRYMRHLKGDRKFDYGGRS